LGDLDEGRAERSARAFAGMASGMPVPDRHFVKRLLEVANEDAQRTRKHDPALVDDFFDACRTAFHLLEVSDSDFIKDHLSTMNAFWMLTREQRERLVRHVESFEPAVYFHFLDI
jgi:RAB protein geranylgeranyltransferase component A